uniref:ACB domain-containing protein n=1 Tax=Mesocestoides corti TaxID=53468 RepID=A0A5K3F558_MESCO
MRNKDFDAACKFYKTNVNKAFILTYDQRLTLSALFNQSKYGQFSSDKAPQVGPLDFVGKERHARWRSLGSMSKTEAQDRFVQSLLQICPQFAAHLEAADTMHCQKDAEEKTRDSVDTAPPSAHGVTGCRSSSIRVSDFTNNESQIRNALNAQTLEQFKTYAAQYYPDDETKQLTLIKQLQDRHFHQYMIYVAGHPSAQSAAISEESTSQAYSDAQSASQKSSGDRQNEECSRNQESVDPTLTRAGTPSSLEGSHLTAVPKQPPTGDLIVPIPDGTGKLTAPQMWTRKDIAEFKSLLSKDPEAVVRVGSGELVTRGGTTRTILPLRADLALKAGWNENRHDSDTGFDEQEEKAPYSMHAYFKLTFHDPVKIQNVVYCFRN